MSDTKRMTWLSRRRQELLDLLQAHPKEIGIVRELVEVNAEIKRLHGNHQPLYVPENYRRMDWIAETN